MLSWKCIFDHDYDFLLAPRKHPALQNSECLLQGHETFIANYSEFVDRHGCRLGGKMNN